MLGEFSTSNTCQVTLTLDDGQESVDEGVAETGGKNMKRHQWFSGVHEIE